MLGILMPSSSQIENLAFSGCSNLKLIEFNGGIDGNICPQAFLDCPSLEKIIIVDKFNSPVSSFINNNIKEVTFLYSEYPDMITLKNIEKINKKIKLKERGE